MKITHRNVITNTIQLALYEKKYREGLVKTENLSLQHVVLGLLPQSHIYSLVVICHASPYRGDQAVILPKFDMKQYLDSIQNYKIMSLYIVSNELFSFRLAENQQLPNPLNQPARTIFCDRYLQSSLICYETKNCVTNGTYRESNRPLLEPHR